jgi:predicted transcriptional regulator
MSRDLELQPLAYVGGWVRETRKELDMTLTELGELVHLSPSQLSRLENNEGNPSYEAVYRVYTTLKERQGEITVASVLASKRERSRELTFEYVEPTDSCADAAALMDEYAISQVPVLENNQSVGSVTDSTLLEVEQDLDSVEVSEIAQSPFPEVSMTTNQETVRTLLRKNQAVLLTDSADVDAESVVGPYVGLVTAADFR